MVSLKRHDSAFYAELLSELLFDNPLETSMKSTKRDVRTIMERTSNEGIGFVTKALPKLGKALDKALVQANFSIPSEFKTAKDSCIPCFMQAYFKLVLHADGSIRHDADAAAICHIRQVCFACYKLEIPYQPLQEAAVIGSFVSTEEELQLSGDLFSSDETFAAGYIIRDLFRDFDHKDISPRHGPGAVSTGERLDDKWDFSRLYDGIHQVYPYYDYFIVGGARELEDRLDWYRSLKRLDKGCAKVVLVPKDSRGPRLISCEPLEYQWIQQGLGRSIMRHLESNRMTGGRVNFTSQEINRQIALSSSRSGEFATLDLKDASDRVSLSLVRALFRSNPDLLRALEATRTSATRLPDGREIQLSKFAPMGSALCFPIEAVCFWAICVASLSRETRQSPSVVGKRVYVFGDDICVPTEYAHVCMQALESHGLKVNRDKSCISGNFRESCGMDAFNGVQVTPVKLRKVWSASRTDGTAYAAYVSYANDLGGKGYKAASDFLWKALRRVYGYIPYGTPTSPYPSREVPHPETAEQLNAASCPVRWNSALCRFEFSVKRIKSRSMQTGLDSWQRLLRSQTMSSPEIDPSVVVIPRSTRIKRGWMPV